MDLSIDKTELLTVLARAQRAVDKSSALAGLRHARMSASGEVLTVTATNLQTQLVTRCPATVPTAGDVGVLPDKLASEVSNISDTTVRLTLDGTRLRVRGQNTKRAFTLATLAAEELVEPKIFERGDEFEVSGEALAQIISRVVHAVSTDETKPHTNSLAFDFNGVVPVLAATDGHRLSALDLSPEFRGSDVRLLPLAAAKVIASAAPNMGIVRVSMTDVGFSMFSERTDITTRTVGAKFPPWRQIVPQEASCQSHISVSATALTAALKAAAVAADPKKEGVTLHISRGGIRVTSTSQEASFDDMVDADVKGRTVDIGCSARYLLDAIAGCESETLAIHVGSELDPILFVAEGFQSVVMPMRI